MQSSPLPSLLHPFSLLFFLWISANFRCEFLLGCGDGLLFQEGDVQSFGLVINNRSGDDDRNEEDDSDEDDEDEEDVEEEHAICNLFRRQKNVHYRSTVCSDRKLQFPNSAIRFVNVVQGAESMAFDPQGRRPYTGGILSLLLLRSREHVAISQRIFFLRFLHRLISTAKFQDL